MTLDLRVSFTPGLGWVVIDKTGRNPCAGGAPILFAAPVPDLCHAWLTRQRQGEPFGKLSFTRDSYLGWVIRDARGDYFGTAKTKALAKDCARIITTNPPPLEGEFMP